MRIKQGLAVLILVGLVSTVALVWQGGGVPIQHADPSGSSPANVLRPPASASQPSRAAWMPDGKAAHSPLDDMAPAVFHSAQGRLVVDAQARTDIDRVAALYARDEALSRLDAATKQLPPQAQRDARDLYQQFIQYNQALDAALPQSAQAQVTLDEARRQLQTLKDLRAQYFGATKAEQMFGQEETMQKQLLDDAAEAMRTQSLPQALAIGQAQAKLARQLERAGSGLQNGP